MTTAKLGIFRCFAESKGSKILIANHQGEAKAFVSRE
jgi:hypothetical protein